MAHTFTFKVTVTVERQQGKFASRDDIVDILTSEIQSGAEGASISGIGADGDSEYEVTDVDVMEIETPKRGHRR